MAKQALLFFNVLNLKYNLAAGNHCIHQIYKLVGNVKVEECVKCHLCLCHSPNF